MVGETYKDREKWNQILFENANKFHLHQDNLRWSLSAGFAVFFYGGINVVYNPTIKIAAGDSYVHFLQLTITLIGTAYFLVLMMEGWYYNLSLCYLVYCEKRVAQRRNLIPLARYRRKIVSPFHPSFACVLFFIAVANTFHLYEFVASEVGPKSGAWAASGYVAVFWGLALWGRVPQAIDATLEKRDRKPKRRYFQLRA
jgi:hypothetical protein